MKKITGLLICLISLQAFAQTSLVNFKEQVILINGISTNVETTILKGDLEDIKKEWVNFTKEQLGQKMTEKDNVLYAEEVVINQVTDKRGDLIVYVYNKDNEVSLNVAFKLGYDIYLNSAQYPEEYKKLKGYVEYFIYNYYNAFLPKHIKEKEKGLKVLVKERDKAKKSIAKSQKKLRKYTSRIKKNNKKLEKYKRKLNKSELDQSKADTYKTKIANLENANSQYESQADFHSGSLKVNQDLINSLEPKIELVNKDLNEARLTLIEVRSKIKLYK